jgi:hypothetical protein
MKKHFARIALFSLVAAALVAVPAASRADDAATTDKPAAAAPALKKKKAKAHKSTFHGSVTAVDTAAMSLTVGSNTVYVTSETIITKAGKPAVLSELTVGETAGGSYKTDEAGKLDAVTINAGEKETKKPKKKAAKAAATPAAPAAPATPPAAPTAP